MEVVKKIYQYAEPNLTLVGWMGFVGFPIYYYVWTYLFPQPYESILLRGVCSILFASIAFRNVFPKHIQRYAPYHYLFVIGFCLPFFFGYMMLMNDWSTIWAMSFMASIFLHILLVHETKVMLIQAVIALVCAYFTVYKIMPVQPTVVVEWPYIPIFLFTYVFGNLFYFRNQIEHEAKVSIAKSFGAGIAHEMRNPLSALKASMEVLSSVLPNSNESKQEVYPLPAKDLTLIRELLSDADEVIRSGNDTIDLLLTSIDQNRVSTSTFKKISAQIVVEEALHSFSYKKAEDKQSVTLEVIDDFEFFGSSTLLKYTLYNLLKNAFYYQSGDSFSIHITLKNQGDQHTILFKDNGIGIEEHLLEDIFKDFYTFGKNGSYGLGLPFCRKVMKAFGGSISCRSILGEWTEFTLTFPRYTSEKVAHIKLDLMKSKTLLYIGRTSMVNRYLSEKSFYLGFRLNNIEPDDALEKEEFEFEFDLIIVDLEILNESPEYLTKLESKLHFTEAKICYLYDQNQDYALNMDRHLTIYPVEKHKLLLGGAAIIDQLMFESSELMMDKNQIPAKRYDYEKRILLVDDNHSLRSFTALLLEKQGFEVLQASDGKNAMAMLESNPIDLIFMDIEMPIMDGIEATSLIRSGSTPYKNIPIIGYTGDTSPVTLDKIRTSGMNDHILKPADKDLLLSKLGRWI
ncbi:hybrid sensor histidine kinase/response regulator [Vibrio aestuarianus]|uniref:hybrid sensor histidine kinase/response regulator n=1 Tax=Vibrio aestuarianus TaxID=28171 RepID=UPI00237CF2BD|nr:hybrid sensor histidine kinase/response regulator [Vibrio aestuarianus]MDE1319474.1 hybrid sensor histidine kinase/response regulator [Vibrio aestuarianus]